MRKFSLLLIVLLLAVASVQVWLNSGRTAQNQEIEASTPVQTTSVNAMIGGAFTLTDQNGQVVRESDFNGRIMLVFFGFTHCPDICPVGITTLSRAMELLKEKADQVAPVFITVDPERDTPEVMKNFLSHFDSRMVGLTGSPEQVKQTVSVYKVYAAKSSTGDGSADYTVDHSGYIYLMDRKGQFVQVMPYNIEVQELVRTMESYLAESVKQDN